MRIHVLTGLLLLSVIAPTTVWAQEPFPTRPITLVVPFPPGGPTDLTARPLAASLEKILKQPVVVANKPGASGAVGISFVAHSKPDGYTILLTSTTTIIPEADKLFGRKPAYTLDQLAPIARISADPPVLMVHPDRPWKNLKELVEDAKRRPGEISYSSSGVYGTLHVAMEMLSHAAGIELRHIPFSGAAPAITAILGGQVDAFAGLPAAPLPHIKAGRLRPLATTGAKRLAALPDVPTLMELGYDVEYYIWVGVFAPSGTPPAVLQTLRKAVREAIHDADFVAALAKIETPIAYLDGDDFQKVLDKEARVIAETVKRIGKDDQAK